MRTLRTRGAAMCLGALFALAGCDATLVVTDDGSLGADAGSLGEDAGPTAPDSGPPDAGARGDAGLADAGLADAGLDDAGTPPEDPESIFFVGNSFTFGGPIPTLVHDLAVAGGHPEPDVQYRAVPGVTLEYHRGDADADGAPNRVGEGWDVVVLQENSLRPTDALGDPAQFKEDATWFHDLAREAQPDTRVILYETWARRAGHSVYDRAFDDPADMQGQLQFHYFDAAETYLPANSTSASPFAEVAPAGDAWAMQLSFGEPPRLHASDDWHAGAAGQYLNALVIYGTIYGRRTRGLVPIGIDTATAEQLQDTADAITGARFGLPVIESPTLIALGGVVRADVGPDEIAAWPALSSINDTVGPVDTVLGEPTGVRFEVSGFTGVQSGGRADNTLGWPGDVSADSLWIGSFDGHAAALGRVATAEVRGLPPGRYTLEVFASRTGTDSGNGRLTRYTVAGAFEDLEVADNASTLARFEDLRPDELGGLRVDVEVSPAGTGRFAYLGAMVLTRVGD